MPNKDPKAIAERTIHLIKNTELREKMGLESRELYEANFTNDGRH